MNSRLKVLAKYPNAYEDMRKNCFRIVDKSTGKVLGFSYCSFDTSWDFAAAELRGSLDPTYHYMISYEIRDRSRYETPDRRTCYVSVAEPLDSCEKILAVVRADVERKIGEWNDTYAFEPVILYLHLLKTENQ